MLLQMARFHSCFIAESISLYDTYNIYIYIYMDFKNVIYILMLLNCVVLEKTLESPLDCKEIKPVNAKGNQS